MKKQLEKFNDDICEVNQLNAELEEYKKMILEKEGQRDKRIKKINQSLFLLKKKDIVELKKDIEEMYERTESEKYCAYLDKIEQKENLDLNEVNELKFCFEEIAIIQKKSYIDIIKGWFR